MIEHKIAFSLFSRNHTYTYRQHIAIQLRTYNIYIYPQTCTNKSTYISVSSITLINSGVVHELRMSCLYVQRKENKNNEINLHLSNF